MKRVLVMVAVVVCALAGVAAPASSEAVPVEVGWWSSNPAATAPDRGLAVSAGPNGAITLAAIRASLSVTTIDSATLTLTEAAGGVQQSGAQLQVCATPNAWTAGPKQSFDKAPRPECDKAKAPLTRSADGKWTADVRTVLSSTSAGDPASPSLMVVPAGSGAVPLGFEVQFQPPQLVVTGTSATSSSSTSSSSSSSGTDRDSDFAAPGSTSGPASSTFDPGPTFSPSAREPLASFSSAQLSGTVEASPTAADSAAAEAIAAPAAAPAAAAPARTVRAVVAPRGSRLGQALFFIVVATMIGVAVGVGHARFRSDGSALA